MIFKVMELDRITEVLSMGLQEEEEASKGE